MKALNELLWSKNFTGNEFDREAVKELCANLTQGEILQLLMELKKDRHNKCFNGNFSVKEIVFYLNKIIIKFAEEKSKKAKIKDFQGSLLEEQEILTQLFVKKYKNKLPKWF